MSSSSRKRGAQPGNRNACKANRQPTPTTSVGIPADIAALIDLGVQFLHERLFDLQQECLKQADQMTLDEKRQMAKAASYAAAAIDRFLRARLLQQSEQQESLSDYINKAVTQLNAESQARRAQEQPVRTLDIPYPPLFSSPGQP